MIFKLILPTIAAVLLASSFSSCGHKHQVPSDQQQQPVTQTVVVQPPTTAPNQGQGQPINQAPHQHHGNFNHDQDRDAYYTYNQRPIQQQQQYYDQCAGYYDQVVYDYAIATYWQYYTSWNQTYFLKQYCVTYKQRTQRIFNCSR